jgi:hypothetical protein
MYPTSPRVQQYCSDQNTQTTVNNGSSNVIETKKVEIPGDDGTPSSDVCVEPPTANSLQTIMIPHPGLKIWTIWPKINIPTSFSQIAIPLGKPIASSQISFLPSLLRQMKFRHLLSCYTPAALFPPMLKISLVFWKVFSPMGRMTIVDHGCAYILKVRRHTT